MDIHQHLQAFGIRPSVHRVEIMRFLQENRIHPTVDVIYSALSPRMPTLSRTTIYNILTLFVEKGIAQNITIDPRQCRYDGDTSEHAHFLCTECGELYDIGMEPIKLESEHHIVQTQLYIKGICRYCKPKKL